jgi:hypothetical protein
MNFRAHTLASRCKWLALALGGLWLLSLVPARYFFGGAGIEASAVSALCCLFAGWLTFWLAARLTQPRRQAFGVLFGTVIRGGFAVIAVLVMQYALGLRYENYLVWLAIFYFAALAFETRLLLGTNTGAQGG